MNKNCSCMQPTILACYPYQRSAMYQCDCCSHMYQPNTSTYPASGPMQENAFMVVNTVPYLIDNTQVKYGTKLSVSESIRTGVTKRPDLSCINLSAIVDMTGDIITNASWNAFLQSTISSQFETLKTILPIQKSNVTFRLHYHLLDVNGGVVYTSHIDSVVKDYTFHYTDVEDFFVTAFKNVMVAEIPAMPYQGIYTIVIDKMEAYVNTINTIDHIVGDMNQFYTWSDNNTKIVVNHDSIAAETPIDETILIASTDINYGMAVQLNVVTRLKISFSAFMSNLIATNDSYGVYKSLFDPVEDVVSKLMQRIEALTTEIETMKSEMDKFYFTSQEYEKGITFHKGVFTWLVPGTVYQTTEAYTVTNDDTITVEEAFAADIAAGKLVLITQQNEP